MFNTPGTDSFSPLFISGHGATHGALLIFHVVRGGREFRVVLVKNTLSI